MGARRLWNIKVGDVPVVIGILGIVSGNLANHLKMVGVTTKIELLQKEELTKHKTQGWTFMLV